MSWRIPHHHDRLDDDILQHQHCGLLQVGELGDHICDGHDHQGCRQHLNETKQNKIAIYLMGMITEAVIISYTRQNKTTYSNICFGQFALSCLVLFRCWPQPWGPGPWSAPNTTKQNNTLIISSIWRVIHLAWRGSYCTSPRRSLKTESHHNANLVVTGGAVGSPVPLVATKLASWQPSVFSVWNLCPHILHHISQ